MTACDPTPLPPLPLVRDTDVCAVCATPMRRTWVGVNDFHWTAADGTVRGGTGPAGEATFEEWLDRLAGSDVAAYSRWLAVYRLAGCAPWQHTHRPTHRAVIDPNSPDVPTCHGWPMQATPFGWVCRSEGTVHAAVTTSASPTPHP